MSQEINSLAAFCCWCPPCRGTAALLLVQHPKDGEMLQYQGAGAAAGLTGLAQRGEKPQCYLVGFAWTRHLWGLCLVLPGDPQ